MTPKEKAKELFDKMYMVEDPMGNYPMCFDTARLCTLIAVDEILKSKRFILSKIRASVYLSNAIDILINDLDYWQEVKHEIEIYER